MTTMSKLKEAYELGRNAIECEFFHWGNPEKDAHFVQFAEGTTEGERQQLARAWVIGYARQVKFEAELDEKYDR